MNVEEWEAWRRIEMYQIEEEIEIEVLKEMFREIDAEFESQTQISPLFLGVFTFVFVILLSSLDMRTFAILNPFILVLPSAIMGLLHRNSNTQD